MLRQLIIRTRRAFSRSTLLYRGCRAGLRIDTIRQLPKQAYHGVRALRLQEDLDIKPLSHLQENSTQNDDRTYQKEDAW